MRGIGKMYTLEQRKELTSAVCPYCRAGLPDMRVCDRQMFVHYIPKTNHEFDCVANELRGFFAGNGQ